MVRVDIPSVAHRSTMRWVGHLAATIAVIAAGMLPPRPGDGFSWSADTIIFDAAASAILLGRHRVPFLVLPAVVAFAAVSLPLGLFNPGVAVASAVAVYTVALYATRRQGVVVTAAVAAVMLAATAIDGSIGIQDVLVVLLGGAVGEAVRTQRDYVASITERAERAERTREALARQRVAEARLAIARDLHDVVAHQISVINLHAGVATTALRDRPSDAEKSLKIIRRASRTVLTEIGDLMATLRDPTAAAGPPGLSQLDDLVREFASHGMEVTVRSDGEAYQVPGATDVTALRIIQEALTNAHKHGSGREAHVLIEFRPHSLRVTVTNPSVPDKAARFQLGTRQGLIGMSERVESVRGTLTYGRDGTGMWFLVAELPTAPIDDEPTI